MTQFFHVHMVITFNDGSKHDRLIAACATEANAMELVQNNSEKVANLCRCTLVLGQQNLGAASAALQMLLGVAKVDFRIEKRDVVQAQRLVASS